LTQRIIGDTSRLKRGKNCRRIWHSSQSQEEHSEISIRSLAICHCSVTGCKTYHTCSRLWLTSFSSFMNWNMPYGPRQASGARRIDHLSPISDIVITTPTSANTAPSPTAAAIMALTAIDRAKVFVEGRHVELLKTMDSEQQR